MGMLRIMHLPEAYGFTGFRREHLPILPQEFKYVPRQIREGKEYKPDPGVLKQLKVIREVFDRSDRIIMATDAGREGDAIHRYIYSYLGCRKPCLRLWVSSLTDRAIRDGLENLRPGGDYDNLYRAAEARAIADYLIGINATQALSIAAGGGDLFARTGADSHARVGLFTLFGEQGFRSADLPSAESHHGKGRQGVRRILRATLRHPRRGKEGTCHRDSGRNGFGGRGTT